MPTVHELMAIRATSNALSQMRVASYAEQNIAFRRAAGAGINNDKYKRMITSGALTTDLSDEQVQILKLVLAQLALRVFNITQQKHGADPSLLYSVAYLIGEPSVSDSAETVAVRDEVAGLIAPSLERRGLLPHKQLPLEPNMSEVDAAIPYVGGLWVVIRLSGHYNSDEQGYVVSALNVRPKELDGGELPAFRLYQRDENDGGGQLVSAGEVIPQKNRVSFIGEMRAEGRPVTMVWRYQQIYDPNENLTRVRGLLLGLNSDKHQIATPCEFLKIPGSHNYSGEQFDEERNKMLTAIGRCNKAELITRVSSLDIVVDEARLQNLVADTESQTVFVLPN